MISTLYLKAGKERATNNRHPWIFSGAVDRVSPNTEDGDIVRICRSDNSTVGFGFYDSKAMIRCRVFEFTDKADLEINDLYWAVKMEKAWQLRADYVLNREGEYKTTACRLIHAEGDDLPGIIADLYENTLVVDYVIEGTFRLREQLNHLLEKLPQVKRVVSRYKRQENSIDTNTPDLVHFSEMGLKYEADINGGQKTGFFLDQRESRFLIRKYAPAKRVLNTFSYSGGFSLNALLAGAEKVDSVDVSAKALNEAEKNLELNAILLGDQIKHHEAIKADCFKFLGEMEDDLYDLIVLDPPAFTKHKKTVPQASRGYKELNLKAFKKIAPGGILFTYSCSQHIDRDLFRKIIFSAAADAHRDVRILHQIGHGIDHPINIYHPENEYLKGLVLKVD